MERLGCTGMRVFFGIEPDQATALAISDWRDRQFGRAGRPVPVANLHMTLAFAGELSVAAIDGLCEAVESGLGSTSLPGTVLALDTTGYWPGPGIYWLGPGSWPDSLEAQARKLRQLVVGAGARRDRRTFQPHITLFRQCSEAPPLPARMPAAVLDYREIALYESRPLRDGVAYHVLQAWPLPGA